MKRVICLIVLLAAMTTVLLAQNAELPRLAVVDFNINSDFISEKIKADAKTVRNLVESEMGATQKYQIITREEIDKLLNEQKIAVLSISSDENREKLKLKKISYIVTGTVATEGNNYVVIVRVLDVATGEFAYSDNAKIGSMDLYNGIKALMTKINKGLSAAGGKFIQTQIVTCKVLYSVHMSGIGWGGYSFDGEMAGTTGQSRQIEAIKIRVESNVLGGITYCTNVQGYGWLKWTSDDQISGTTGQSRRMEAIKINLTGRLGEQFNVRYRVHIQNFGWSAWTMNGEMAGTEGKSLRLEAIEIRIERK